MKHFTIYTFFLVLVGHSIYAQSKFDAFFKPSDSLNKPRLKAVVISETSLAGLTLIGLNQLWYRDFKRSKFHTINDNNEWLQLDKFGHVFASYQLGKLGANVLNWSGVDKDKQLIYGATLGFSFLAAVEIFDGFSQEWGFSWGDILANASGTSLYVGQELLWKEQRIALKYSFHQTKYASQNPEKLGNGFLEEVLKDYNGQTYWLSVNIHSFFKKSKLPKWLNLAIGYGGEGMLTGTNSTDTILFQNQDRYRQYYISFDVDLTKIKTKSHFLRSLFGIFSAIKVPFPALEFSRKHSTILHGIYF